MEEDPGQGAILRLSVLLHLHHADAGDGRQPAADVLRVGGRGRRQLSADRLLVPQGKRQPRRDEGVHRQPRRAISASCWASSGCSTWSTASSSTTCSPPRRCWRRPRFAFLGMEVNAAETIALLLFVGACGKSAQFLLHTWLPDAMEGPTPGVGADPRGHHGHRRRVHGLPHVAGVRGRALRAVGGHHRRRHHGVLRRDGRAGADRHQAGDRLFHLLAAWATCSPRPGWASTRRRCSTCSPTPSSRRCCSWAPDR